MNINNTIVYATVYIQRKEIIIIIIIIIITLFETDIFFNMIIIQVMY